MKPMIVTVEVRKVGSIGLFVEAQFTHKAEHPEVAQAAVSESMREDGYETRGFSVHDELTRELLLGGGMKVDGRMRAEADIIKAKRS